MFGTISLSLSLSECVLDKQRKTAKGVQPKYTRSVEEKNTSAKRKKRDIKIIESLNQ
jgi:hypothetical protein